LALAQPREWEWPRRGSHRGYAMHGIFTPSTEASFGMSHIYVMQTIFSIGMDELCKVQMWRAGEWSKCGE
jgi:hypothetical protein